MQHLRRPLSTGARGESLAARHLKRGDYRILARNVRNRFGEIDLVAQAPDGRTLVIVEVKTTQSTAPPLSMSTGEASEGAGIPGATGGSPASAQHQRRSSWRPEVHVTADKQRRLVALAVQYVRRHRLQNRPIRFDVIGVDLPENRKAKPTIRHHIGAFDSHV